jgi:acetate kinase
MKRFILTEQQLREYVESKKAEKVFYDILEQIHRNKKFLNENVSHKKANQSVINRFQNKKLINQKVFEMLTKHKIINENYEII